MTTKLKIIFGFVIMIALTAAVAVVGYMGLGKASDQFTSYRQRARINVALGSIMDTTNNVSSYIFQFVGSGERADILNAKNERTVLEEKVKETKQMLKTEAHQKMIAQVEVDLATLRDAIDSIDEDMVNIFKQYDSAVQPALKDMIDALEGVQQQALRVNNLNALSLVADTFRNLSHARSSVSRFSRTRSDQDGQRTLETLGWVGESITALGQGLYTDEGKALFQNVQEAYTKVQTALTDMRRRSVDMARDMESIMKVDEDIHKVLTQVSSEVDTMMRAQGDAALEANSTAQNTMLSASVASIVIGALLAMVIIIGIVKVLRDLSAFAGNIAKGDFNATVKTREKGEIGVMVSAMEQIPAALNAILADYGTLEKEVEHGKLNASADENKFSGGFATIIRASNAIMSRFRIVLESMPSPVVVMDKDLKAAYLNAVGRDLAGADYTGKTCLQLFAREDFGPNDALSRAVSTKHPVSSETKARPQGREMDISYTAIPMFDNKGNLASVLQLFTDLTDIKRTQRTIIEVAGRAAEISTRVAAAAEELSAQVEQVSRGAEMQRERVESTASAMTEMNSTVLEVARSAGQASEQTELTREKASSGSGLVNQVVQSIHSVNNVARGMQTNMQELGTQAENIGGVMNVISDIADQTNLLALNAAIEAARAGEAGRGFAVVADEVRKLAEKTMTATQEVGSNIAAIQHSARANIEHMANAVKGVTEATELANSSGEALKEIVELASANSAVVTSIATAAEEQSSTSEEINASIEEINRIVAETAEGMVQSNAALQELSHMAQELRSVMDQLK